MPSGQRGPASLSALHPVGTDPVLVHSAMYVACLNHVVASVYDLDAATKEKQPARKATAALQPRSRRMTRLMI